MNTLAPAPIAFEPEPGLTRSIDRILPWPPEVTWAFGHSQVVERGDTVVAAELMTPADGVITLRMCKADGQEYGIELSLPTATAESVLEAIQPGMTLAAVGELEPTTALNVVEAVTQPPA
jgi:hypothetical protein